MKITSAEDADMETFLAVLGAYLGEIGAETTIDLYVDFAITEPEPRRLLAELRGVARARSTNPGRRRKGDLYMAVPLDLATEEGVIYFSRLAHRTIDCESVLDNELIFSTVENERIVCLELPERQIEVLESKARRAGATTLSRLG
ncbi:hypothetical protein [Streptomyces sp. NPDC005209]|uniref:hypothetical protein n=1 Tax=Streptomyces sp. NPDC005209 TaxID=3156715 RepID=UPI0033A7F97D